MSVERRSEVDNASDGRCLRLTVGNLKGGTGKSTTAVFLALALSRWWGRVLLVCADDSNATTYTWAEMAGDGWPSNITVQRWPTLHLAKMVREAEGLFDHLVIDTGRDPAVLRNALTVTDTFVMPIAPTVAEITRLQDTLNAAAEVGATKDLDLAILLTRAGLNTRSLADVRQHLTEERHLPVLSSVIPSLQRYAQAMGTVPRNVGPYGAALTELIEQGRP